MHRFLNVQQCRFKCIISFILFIFVVTLLSNEHFDIPSRPPKNRTIIVPVPLANRSSHLSFGKINFSLRQIYHFNGIAYDFYSKDEFNRTEAADQWKSWPLTDKNLITSPSTLSRLPFVQAIYVMTDPRLVDRHKNLRKVFQRQGLSMDLVQWRMKWNQTTCTHPSNLPFVTQRLNLKTSSLNEAQQKRCALVMKHTDVWYEMAEKNISLGLILEDDAIFVPFFKEKFTRMIFAALNQRILRFDGHCAETNQTVNQDPMFVLGTCFNFHDRSFETNLTNARPIFSRQKSSASRCSHAYLLTSCSAKALVREIQRDKNDFWPADFLQNHLFRRSTTLESFWIDPSLVYQGNQVIDLDGVETFRKQTYL